MQKVLLSVTLALVLATAVVGVRNTVVSATSNQGVVLMADGVGTVPPDTAMRDGVGTVPPAIALHDGVGTVPPADGLFNGNARRLSSTTKN